MDNVGTMLGEQLANCRTGHDMREIEHPQPLQRSKCGWLESTFGAVCKLAKLDRRHIRQRLALRVCAPFLRGAFDGGAQAEGREFVLERLGIVQSDAFGDRLVVTRAIQETQNAIAQMLVSTIEEDLTIIASMIEAIHRRKHGTKVELPAALKEIGDFVKEQLGVSPIDLGLLFAKTATLAN